MKKPIELGLQEYLIEGDTLRVSLKSSEHANPMQSLLSNIKQGLTRIERMEHGLTQVGNTPRFNDLASCINYTCQAFKKTSANKINVEIELVDIPPITIDFTKVSQVLTHLLHNANQAINQRISRGGAIKLKTLLNDDSLHICVSDNGCGIPNSSLNKIFDPLFTTKKEKDETGLGLAISKDICHELGGSLNVKSEIGKGSEFIMHLPLVNARLH